MIQLPNTGAVQARLASLREPNKGVILQSETQEELDALSSSPSAASGIPSVLDRAFKPLQGASQGEL